MRNRIQGSAIRVVMTALVCAASAKELISVQDVFPKMLDLCGLPAPKDMEFSGRSFKRYPQNPLNP